MSQFSWEHLIWFSGGAGWISDEYRKTKVWGRMNNLQSFNLCENWKTKVWTKNDCREDLKSAQRPIAGTWNDTLKHKFISPVFSASPKTFQWANYRGLKQKFHWPMWMISAFPKHLNEQIMGDNFSKGFPSNWNLQFNIFKWYWA